VAELAVLLRLAASSKGRDELLLSAEAPTQGDATRRGAMELAGRGGGARGRIGDRVGRARCPRHDDMGRDVSGMDGAARRHQSLSISGDVFSGMWVGGWVPDRALGTTDDCVACAGRGQSQCCRPAAVRRPGCAGVPAVVFCARALRYFSYGFLAADTDRSLPGC
jgi:hypothetical protein